MYNLFNKFPIISYNGQLAVNLISKIKFTEAAKAAAASYYPYTISEGERPDIIAANYYDDARYSWLIYMVNDIMDPYYDWPLTEEEFSKFIAKKYGSEVAATESIAFWRVNWFEDESILTPAAYQALPAAYRKYYGPVVSATGSVAAYERAKIDYATETNKIQELSVTSTTGFVIGEQVNQKTSGNITGTAFIKGVLSSTVILVQHVLGSFATTAGTIGNVIGGTSSSTTAVSSVNTIASAIPDGESVFWTYVTNYDHEQELNEQKRHINLLDRSYVDQVEKELDQLL